MTAARSAIPGSTTKGKEGRLETSGCSSTSRKKKNRESGQATVEFALAMILVMGFMFFVVQLSLVFAWGNYIQYATHMAARAYLAAGPTRDDQMERAKDVIYRALKKGRGRGGADRVPAIARGVGVGDPAGLSFDHPRFNPEIRGLSWLEGVRYSFRSRVFLLPLGRMVSSATNSNVDVNYLTLVSEDWMGREPSHEECLEQVRSRNGGIVDNGC